MATNDLIDFNRIMIMHGLNKKELARILFPDHGHPYHAFQRSIKKNGGDLKISELTRLATGLGKSVNYILNGCVETGNEKNEITIGSTKAIIDSAKGVVLLIDLLTYDTEKCFTTPGGLVTTAQLNLLIASWKTKK